MKKPSRRAVISRLRRFTQSDIPVRAVKAIPLKNGEIDFHRMLHDVVSVMTKDEAVLAFGLAALQIISSQWPIPQPPPEANAEAIRKVRNAVLGLPG